MVEVVSDAASRRNNEPVVDREIGNFIGAPFSPIAKGRESRPWTITPQKRKRKRPI